MHENQFVETINAPKTEAALAGAIMRHWRSRHLHSKALVLCDSPEALLKIAQKQWRRFIQQTQQERLQNTGADRILTLTYEITHMQHARLVADSPEAAPSAHMWVMPPSGLADPLPTTCRSVYIVSRLSKEQRSLVVELLPRYAVVADFGDNHRWQLAPKSELERKVNDAWSEVVAFLISQDIQVADLTGSNIDIEAIDNALDILLDRSGAFLHHAHHFQEVLALAEPLVLDHQTKQQYDAICLLARRVSFLVPNTFGRFFAQSSDDTFFMYDRSRHAVLQGELEQKIRRHQKAGRHNIVFALERKLLNSYAVVSR